MRGGVAEGKASIGCNFIIAEVKRIGRCKANAIFAFAPREYLRHLCTVLIVLQIFYIIVMGSEGGGGGG